MEIFPKDIWDLIKRYKKDMELLQLSPTPIQFENTVMGCDFMYPLVNNNDCQTFLLHRFMELMLGNIRHSHLEGYLKMFVQMPLSLLEDYIHAKEIFRERNRIWGIGCEDTTPLNWYYHTALVIKEYVTNRDTNRFVTQLMGLANDNNSILVTP